MVDLEKIIQNRTAVILRHDKPTDNPAIQQGAKIGMTTLESTPRDTISLNTHIARKKNIFD
ncbi:MAG: hypothetical protein DA330_08265 [Nitrososphaera sp.]|nr:hypothetical protein [Nitrososphaera sp.]